MSTPIDNTTLAAELDILADTQPANNVLSIAADRLRELERENAELRERHLLQLAAISTATLQNTVSARADRITPDNPYYTVAYGDVCRAVDREMELRAAVFDLAVTVEFMRALCEHSEDFPALRAEWSARGMSVAIETLHRHKHLIHLFQKLPYWEKARALVAESAKGGAK